MSGGDIYGYNEYGFKQRVQAFGRRLLAAFRR